MRHATNLLEEAKMSCCTRALNYMHKHARTHTHTHKHSRWNVGPNKVHVHPQKPCITTSAQEIAQLEQVIGQSPAGAQNITRHHQSECLNAWLQQKQ
eukprot:1138197-Pelagomonas_calceolata.AAC.3